jgi:hypothetical protein
MFAGISRVPSLTRCRVVADWRRYPPMTAVEMPERRLAAANDHGERSGEGLLVALVFPAALGARGRWPFG